MRCARSRVLIASATMPVRGAFFSCSSFVLVLEFGSGSILSPQIRGRGRARIIGRGLRPTMDSGKLLPMKYRRFGRTGLQMPVISCGGMRYQFKWQDVAPNEIPADNQKNLEATIHRALELGINHIETARGYGSSEMQLGRVLPKLAREKIIVQTKIAPMES